MSYLRIYVPALFIIGGLAWALATGQQPEREDAQPTKVAPKPLTDPGSQKALDDAGLMDE